VTRIEVSNEGVTVTVLRCLAEAGVRSMRTSRPSLEEVYLELVGDRGLRL
jgi:ABC-2 type transport system ATP-binding protein